MHSPPVARPLLRPRTHPAMHTLKHVHSLTWAWQLLFSVAGFGMRGSEREGVDGVCVRFFPLSNVNERHAARREANLISSYPLFSLKGLVYVLVRVIEQIVIVFFHFSHLCLM